MLQRFAAFLEEICLAADFRDPSMIFSNSYPRLF
jgi:hypothetical protein